MTNLYGDQCVAIDVQMNVIVMNVIDVIERRIAAAFEQASVANLHLT